MAQANANAQWKYSSVHDLLVACVGTNFGEKPEENIDEIRKDRERVGAALRYALALRASDSVADIGSGCGFVTRSIVPHVAHVWCIDISPDFLNYCRQELAEFSNVSFCNASYATFSGIGDSSLDACYSTAVFIHFNYYDYVYYLREINRVLTSGGKFLFDFLNADSLDIAKQRAFASHLANYSRRRESLIFNVVHPMSLRALENLMPQAGFEILRVDYLSGSANTRIIVRKVAAG